MQADCLSFEVLAALKDGSLFDGERDAETHLASCLICRATLALSIRLENDFEPQPQLG